MMEIILLCKILLYKLHNVCMIDGYSKGCNLICKKNRKIDDGIPCSCVSK